MIGGIVRPSARRSPTGPPNWAGMPGLFLELRQAGAQLLERCCQAASPVERQRGSAFLHNA